MYPDIFRTERLSLTKANFRVVWGQVCSHWSHVKMVTLQLGSPMSPCAPAMARVSEKEKGTWHWKITFCSMPTRKRHCHMIDSIASTAVITALQVGKLDTMTDQRLSKVFVDKWQLRKFMAYMEITLAVHWPNTTYGAYWVYSWKLYAGCYRCVSIFFLLRVENRQVALVMQR